MNQTDIVGVHDEEFYLEDGDFMLRVENTLFKVIFPLFSSLGCAVLILRSLQGAQIRAQQRLVHLPEHVQSLQ
jgi:ABC-type polysaccharide transport system permease subunit